MTGPTPLAEVVAALVERLHAPDSRAREAIEAVLVDAVAPADRPAIAAGLLAHGEDWLGRGEHARALKVGEALVATAGLVGDLRASARAAWLLARALQRRGRPADRVRAVDQAGSAIVLYQHLGDTGQEVRARLLLARLLADLPPEQGGGDAAVEAELRAALDIADASRAPMSFAEASLALARALTATPGAATEVAVHVEAGMKGLRRIGAGPQAALLEEAQDLLGWLLMHHAAEVSGFPARELGLAALRLDATAAVAARGLADGSDMTRMRGAWYHATRVIGGELGALHPDTDAARRGEMLLMQGQLLVRLLEPADADEVAIADEVLREAGALRELTGDHAGACRAWQMRAVLLARCGRWAEVLGVAGEARRRQDALGDPGLVESDQRMAELLAAGRLDVGIVAEAAEAFEEARRVDLGGSRAGELPSLPAIRADLAPDVALVMPLQQERFLDLIVLRQGTATSHRTVVSAEAVQVVRGAADVAFVRWRDAGFPAAGPRRDAWRRAVEGWVQAAARWGLAPIADVLREAGVRRAAWVGSGVWRTPPLGGMCRAAGLDLDSLTLLPAAALMPDAARAPRLRARTVHIVRPGDRGAGAADGVDAERLGMAAQLAVDDAVTLATGAAATLSALLDGARRAGVVYLGGGAGRLALADGPLSAARLRAAASQEQLGAVVLIGPGTATSPWPPGDAGAAAVATTLLAAGAPAVVGAAWAMDDAAAALLTARLAAELAAGAGVAAALARAQRWLSDSLTREEAAARLRRLAADALAAGEPAAAHVALGWASRVMRHADPTGLCFAHVATWGAAVVWGAPDAAPPPGALAERWHDAARPLAAAPLQMAIAQALRDAELPVDDGDDAVAPDLVSDDVVHAPDAAWHVPTVASSGERDVTEPHVRVPPRAASDAGADEAALPPDVDPTATDLGAILPALASPHVAESSQDDHTVDPRSTLRGAGGAHEPPAFDRASVDAMMAAIAADAALLAVLDALREAAQAADRGDHVTAVAGFRAVVAARPDLADAWVRLAAAEEAAGLAGTTGPAGRLDRALDAFPDHRGALLWRARLALATGDTRLARLHLRRAVLCHPHDPEAWRALADLMDRVGEAQAAVEYLRAAERLTNPTLRAGLTPKCTRPDCRRRAAAGGTYQCADCGYALCGHCLGRAMSQPSPRLGLCPSCHSRRVLVSA